MSELRTKTRRPEILVFIAALALAVAQALGWAIASLLVPPTAHHWWYASAVAACASLLTSWAWMAQTKNRRSPGS